ncbi:MAG: hypothetical protein PHC29_03920 [Candidatus Omnitrophica bacterium]|nr:hypothetical protein [Candidatus Omnitrophota bacterium]
MYRIVIGFAMIWVCFLVANLRAQELNWQDISCGNHNAGVILVNQADNNTIFIGIPGSILKSEDAGKSWRSVLTLRGAMRNINCLSVNSINYNCVYAATDNGLYRSNNLGDRWERIFQGKNNLEKQCTSIIGTLNTLFVGTKAGLFISRDNGRSWNKERGEIDKNAILNIDFVSKKDMIIYLAAVNGIFKSLDSGRSWERIFSSYSRENNKVGSVDQDVDVPENSSDIRFVKAGINNINLVYLSSAKGVYKSLDQGRNWQKLPEYGLLNRDVKVVCLSDNSQVLALSESGIFLYGDERWAEVSFGLLAGKLKSFALDDKGNIYAAGERGVFNAKMSNHVNFGTQVFLQEYLKNEPKIKEVQDAAIKYAEVSPEKISQWRKKAAKKALLPQVNVGVDRNSTDLWHWEGGSTTRSDDDTLRRGRDAVDWDVSLSWDLSNVVWNDAQTSIDVRSKLMVELRNDILDQVNKLYFERLRVKSELDNLAIEDRSKRFDKQLKLQELTASLDSLTAGYYSEQLRKLATQV